MENDLLEIKKIGAIFQALKRNFKQGDLIVSFRTFQDGEHASENTNALADDFLFGNAFANFPLFTGLILCRWMQVQLIIHDDDASQSVKAKVRVSLNDNPKEALLSKEYELDAVRKLLWNIYYFINSHPHGVGAEKVKAIFQIID